MTLNDAEAKIDKLIEEAEIKKWSAEVTKNEKFHPPEGTFKKAPKEIASIISEEGKASYQTTMARLNFFLNRGGDNISQDIKNRVTNAKEIVRKRYKKDKR